MRNGQSMNNDDKKRSTEDKNSSKKNAEKKPPIFGPFKQGDPLHKGHNKCIGYRNGTSEEQYIEEMD